MQVHVKAQRGFTLIELSIVLVIIGLIVGGVLVGQDLIRAAEVRATISQIEKYNTAVNTFRGKYNALPGDIPAVAAAQFGFTAGMPRNGGQGLGDGNGLIEGIGWCCATLFVAQLGEPMLFWEDLSVNSPGLIDGSFGQAPGYSNLPGTITPTSSPSFNAYFPTAKLGNGNYIVVDSYAGVNYFSLEVLQSLPSNGFTLSAIPGLTVARAYAIDKKMDDGLPQGGSLQAYFVNSSTETGCPSWSAGGGVEGQGWCTAPFGSPATQTVATPGSSTTCYDNGNVAGAAQQYSVEQNNGAGVNCALSFRFQ